MSRLRDVNSFIEQARTARTADDLRGLMEPITREMGFSCYALFQHVKRFDWANTRQLAISNFPRGWLEYYFEKRLVPRDPIHLASYRTGVGFAFDEIPRLIQVGQREIAVMEAFHKAGLVDGFCVPSHIPGETDGTCSFVVEKGRALPRDNFPMAQLVGSFAYEAARQMLLAGGDLVRRPERLELSHRQLECIVLLGKGKTDWEIATILGCKEETVTSHINEARRRCQVSRRSELPIHALYNGDLTFRDFMD